MSSFTSELILTPLPDGRRFRLVQEFDYAIGAEGSGRVVRVPEGFVTDFASIPRALWWLLPPWGKYGKAAIVHDRLYQNGPITEGPGSEYYPNRAETDAILNEAMGVLGVNRLTRWTIYTGVRSGGQLAWAKGHRA